MASLSRKSTLFLRNNNQLYLHKNITDHQDRSDSNLYFLEIPFSFLGGLGTSLGEVERLEVLKGPQGTMFGRNSTAGAINVVLRDPGEAFEFHTMTSYGSFNALNTKAYIAGPLFGGVKASLSGIYNEEDSYYEHTDPNNYGKDTRYGDRDEPGFQKRIDEGVRLKLVWDITDSLSVKASAYTLDSVSSSGAILATYRTKPLGDALGVTPRESSYKNDINSETANTAQNDVYSFNLTWSNEDFTLRTISGLQNINFFASTDYDGSSENILAFGTPMYSDNMSHEIQLLSNDGGRFSELYGRPINWIIGAYYFEDETGFNPNFFTAVNQAELLDSIPLFSTLDGISGGILSDSLDQDVLVKFFGILDIESNAVFSQATWDLSDTIGLTIGARYQEEERVNINSSAFLATNDFGDIPLTEFPATPIKTTNISPRLVIDFKPGEDTLFYMSFSRGFKSGTLNTVALIEAPQIVAPEEMTTYEIGLKRDFLDSTMRLNGAVFQNNVKNGQVFFISVLSGGVANLENAGEYTIQGAEIDMTWQLNESWVFKSSLAYLDGEYDEYIGSGYDENSGILNDNMNFEGNKTNRTPEITGNISVSYFTYALGGEWELNADAYYSDEFFFDAQNRISQESYSLYGARISYLYDEWNLRATLFGRNIGDEEYATLRYASDFSDLENMAPPRQLGLQLDWRY